jgi:uncharacterized hydrophobic protein (TIGR00271 family)
MTAAGAPPPEQPSPERATFLETLKHGWLAGDDRCDIFAEVAGGATNIGLPYALILLLAAAIAALGLALNSAAVIIGAMLIAPLMGPIVGLGMGLAIGDGRLAVETAFVVLASTAAVIVTAALLAFALPVPFQTVTAEIVSRTRPTTLDLAIAVCSGLAGAVVAVARRSRLSAAVPGVAVSVALVPPLAVTGYGIGTGWNWPIIRGSLLLYGANLAGIVMSATVVFILAGMYRSEVLAAVRRWHAAGSGSALSAWVGRIPGLRSLGVMKSIPARLALVGGFVALVAIPLSASLKQIARETRVQHAIDGATAIFSKSGESFIVSRDVDLTGEEVRVVLNVATTHWFGDSAQRTFEQRATAAAGEPVTLVLEQLPASSGDVSQLATLITGPRTAAKAPLAPSVTAAQRVGILRAEVAEATRSLTLPDSIAVLASNLVIADSSSPVVLRLVYAGSEPLSTQAVQMAARQLSAKLAIPDLRLALDFVTTRPRSVDAFPSPEVDSVVVLLRRYPALRVEVLRGSAVPRSRLDSTVARLAAVVADSGMVRDVPSRGLAIRIAPR